ncbi:MAG TPA: hypothetical protein VKO84_08845 [Gaiellaceae bacterium]|nr:hypothetical protein [Gaiellaceae bacterium]
MLLKIFIVGAIAIGIMAAIKDGRVLRDAGLLSRCSAVSASNRSELSCTKGRLDGFPNLTNQSCELVSASASRQVWRCAAPVVSSQSPNG